MTSSAWPSTREAVGDGSCARLISGAVINQIPASQSPRPFCFHITSFPPFFERRTCLAEPHGHDSHSSFCEEVFSCTAHTGTNEVDRTNILAPGFTLLPAFTASECFRRTIGRWEVVSSYSSATAPDFHGISCADPLS